jgi:PAS domain S-box-containing protein
VLLVEDNPDDAFLLTALLNRSGANFELFHTDRADRAEERIRSESFDAVVSDLGLPDSEGLETVRRFVAAAGETPVIALTGLDDEAIAVEALKEGLEDYLIKDQLSPSLLSRVIRYAIQRNQNQRDLRRHEMELTDLFENSRTGIQWVDGGGKILRVNQSLLAIVGRSLEDCLRTPVTAVFAESEAVRTILLDVQAGHHRSQTLTVRRPGGDRTVEIDVNGYWEEGRFRFSRWFVHDVTDHVRTIADLQKSLAEVRTLKGLIPICASCKRVRNDRGYWDQIEKYVRERTDAEFAHDVCPDCFRKLYPEIAMKYGDKIFGDEKP